MRCRRFLAVLALACAAVWSVPAQGIGSSRIGVTAGFTSSSVRPGGQDVKSYSLYSAGLACQVHLGAGFSLQPALMLQAKGSVIDGIDTGPGWNGTHPVHTGMKTRVNYIEIPVQVQWGPDLLVVRPYVFAEPFLGYAVSVNNRITMSSSASAENTVFVTKDFRDMTISRFAYGFGIGGGIEFWRLQLSARYYWNLGSLYSDTGELNDVTGTVSSAFRDGRSFDGFTVSAAVFF